ncbi:MAG: class I SAM-dependent methyltransferase [Sedimentisphaerales bacterium]
MPVNKDQISGEVLYQRDQWQKGGLGRAYWAYRDRVVLSLLDERDTQVVDLGCGEGITLQKMVKMLPASEVLGIDCIQENINICLKHNLPARQGDIYVLDLAEDSVDAVVLIEVIEHLERPEMVVNEIHRVLKPGGKLVLVYPNDAIFKIARIATLRFKEAAYDAGHLKQWMPREIETLLKEKGFDVVSTKCLPFLFWSVSLHGVTFARKI